MTPDHLSALELAVLALAACRGTQLVLHDRILEPFRKVMKRLGEYPAYLVGCPWCISVWVGLLIMAGLRWATTVTWFLVGALALSLLAVAIDRLFDRFLPDELPAGAQEHPLATDVPPPMPRAAAAALSRAQGAAVPATHQE